MFFYSKGCGHCHEIVEASKDISNKENVFVRYNIEKVDISTELHQKALRYGPMIHLLKGTPMLVILHEHEDGSLHPIEADGRQQKVDPVVGKAPKWHATYLDYFDEHWD